MGRLVDSGIDEAKAGRLHRTLPRVDRGRRPAGAGRCATRWTGSADGQRRAGAVDEYANYAHGGLLALVTLGWLLWFAAAAPAPQGRGCARQQAGLQRQRRPPARAGAEQHGPDRVLDHDSTVSFIASRRAMLGVPAERPRGPAARRPAPRRTPPRSRATCEPPRGRPAPGCASALQRAHPGPQGTITDLSFDPAVRGWVLNARDVTERHPLERPGAPVLPRRADRPGQPAALRRPARARPVPAAPPAEPLAVLLCDLDDFKHVNDSRATRPVTRCWWSSAARLQAAAPRRHRRAARRRRVRRAARGPRRRRRRRRRTHPQPARRAVLRRGHRRVVGSTRASASRVAARPAGRRAAAQRRRRDVLGQGPRQVHRGPLRVRAARVGARAARDPRASCRRRSATTSSSCTSSRPSTCAPTDHRLRGAGGGAPDRGGCSPRRRSSRSPSRAA